MSQPGQASVGLSSECQSSRHVSDLDSASVHKARVVVVAVSLVRLLLLTGLAGLTDPDDRVCCMNEEVGLEVQSASIQRQSEF